MLLPKNNNISTGLIPLPLYILSGGLPAIVMGYIDRVMSNGFAYRYDDGLQKRLLKGKKQLS